VVTEIADCDTDVYFALCTNKFKIKVIFDAIFIIDAMRSTSNRIWIKNTPFFVQYLILWTVGGSEIDSNFKFANLS
jgi:hypothetical protein